MIISHRLKFAFFRSPKTGSTTTELILRMCGVFDEDRDVVSAMPRYGLTGDHAGEPHLSPSEAIEKGFLTIEQAREYKMFATLRDPYGRAVSIFGHAHQRLSGINNKDVFEEMTLRDAEFGLLEKPQVDYFYVGDEQVCEPVDFRDFASSVKSFLKNDVGSLPGGATPIEFPVIPNFNVTGGKGPSHNRVAWIDHVNPKVKQRLATKYAADITLWEKYYGTL